MKLQDGEIGRGICTDSENRRVEMNLGYACNNFCVFCSESLNRRSEMAERAKESLTTEYILATLQKLYLRGFRHLTFLGGEPTIRSDFLKLVRAAKRIGYINIFLTTNGRMLAREGYPKALFASGLTELYISLHGPDSETHDRIVQAKGAFDQVKRGIEQLNEGGLPFHVSSVITRYNANRLPDLARFQIESKAARIFWSLVRPIGGAFEHFDEIVAKVSDVDEAIKKSLSLAESSGIPMTIAHLPLCRMKGYERYIDELYWNHADINREVFFIDNVDALEKGEDEDGRIITKRHRKVKGPDCISCRYVRVCEGVMVEYANRYGFDEFVPVEGELFMHSEELQDRQLAKKGNEK